MRSIALLIAFCAAVFAQASEYNSIYRGENGEVFSREPNAFLVQMIRGRKPGTIPRMKAFAGQRSKRIV